MWVEFKKLLKDCLTENDAHSYDPFRVGGAVLSGLSFPTFIGCSIYSVVNDPSHHFEMVAFASAFATMLGGIALLAGGVAFKARTDTFNAPLDRHEDH